MSTSDEFMPDDTFQSAEERGAALVEVMALFFQSRSAPLSEVDQKRLSSLAHRLRRSLSVVAEHDAKVAYESNDKMQALAALGTKEFADILAFLDEEEGP